MTAHAIIFDRDGVVVRPTATEHDRSSDGSPCFAGPAKGLPGRVSTDFLANPIKCASPRR